MAEAQKAARPVGAQAAGRAIPNSFSGGAIDITPMKGLKVYGAMYNEWSPRSDAHVYEFKTDRLDGVKEDERDQRLYLDYTYRFF